MLTIVTTPIGNLNDISIRALSFIFSAEIILAEDTRKFGIFYENLKERFSNIIQIQKHKPELISFHKLNEFQRVPEIIELLKQGENIALVSESGMPGISDPGNLLISECIRGNIPFAVIPGPSAFATALVYSGFNPNNALFIGYFPKQKSKQKKIIQSWKKIQQPLVIAFYESPYRLNQTLEFLSQEFINAQFCICREMTKKFEEIVRFDSHNIPKREWKGEITVVMKIN